MGTPGVLPIPIWWQTHLDHTNPKHDLQGHFASMPLNDGNTTTTTTTDRFFPSALRANHSFSPSPFVFPLFPIPCSIKSFPPLVFSCKSAQLTPHHPISAKSLRISNLSVLNKVLKYLLWGLGTAIVPRSVLTVRVRSRAIHRRK